MNDMKAAYKILKLLSKYRGDETFDYEMISASALNMGFNQWEQLMIEMQEKGLIKGLTYTQTMTQKFPHIVEPIRPKITFDGIEFLANNSAMAKAKEALAMVGDLIP